VQQVEAPCDGPFTHSNIHSGESDVQTAALVYGDLRRRVRVRDGAPAEPRRLQQIQKPVAPSMRQPDVCNDQRAPALMAAAAVHPAMSQQTSKGRSSRLQGLNKRAGSGTRAGGRLGRFGQQGPQAGIYDECAMTTGGAAADIFGPLSF